MIKSSFQFFPLCYTQNRNYFPYVATPPLRNGNITWQTFYVPSVKPGGRRFQPSSSKNATSFLLGNLRIISYNNSKEMPNNPLVSKHPGTLIFWQALLAACLTSASKLSCLRQIFYFCQYNQLVSRRIYG
jgi:hypothetical protein